MKMFQVVLIVLIANYCFPGGSFAAGENREARISQGDSQPVNFAREDWGGASKGGRVAKIHLENIGGGFLGSLVLRFLGASEEQVPKGFGILDFFIVGGCGYLIFRQRRLPATDSKRRLS